MLPERLSNGCVPVFVYSEEYIKLQEVIKYKELEYQYTILNLGIESITYCFKEGNKKIAINCSWIDSTINWRIAFYRNTEDKKPYLSRYYISQKYQDIIKNIFELKATNILKLKKELNEIRTHNFK